MNQRFKRVVSICLASALITSVSSTALTAYADETQTQEIRFTKNGLEIDENGDVVVNFDNMPTGADLDVNADYGDHKIESMSDYEEFAEENAPQDDRAPKNGANTLPDAVDNTQNENSIYFPPIGNQNEIGSCAAWATTYYQYTYMMNKARGVATTPENTYSPTWSYNLTNGGDDNGSNAYKIYNVFSDMGVATAADVPIQNTLEPAENYLSWHAEGNVWEHASHNRISDYRYFTSTVYDDGELIETSYPISPVGTPVTNEKDEDLDALKTALANGDIIAFGTYVLGWKFKAIPDSPYYNTDNSHVGEMIAYASVGELGGHAMTIVGYNDGIWCDINENHILDRGELGAFKIANSWGEEKGNDGYFWLAYDALNEKTSVLAADNQNGRIPALVEASTISIDSEECEDMASGLYLKYVLSASSRFFTDVEITAVDKNDSSNVYTSEVNPYRCEYYNDSGYNYSLYVNDSNKSFNGVTGENEGTMYFDLGEVVPGITRDTVNNYEWDIKVSYAGKNDSLQVKQLQFVDSSDDASYNIFYGGLNYISDSYLTYHCDNVNFTVAPSVEISVTPETGLSVCNQITVSAAAQNGLSPYQYKYEVSNGDYTVTLSDWTSEASIVKPVTEAGTVTVTAYVKDSANRIASASKTIEVAGAAISDIVPNVQNAHVNDTVVFTPVVSGLPSTVNGSNYRYIVTNNGISALYSANSNGSLTFTPAAGGDYTIKCEILCNNKIVAAKSVEYSVEGTSNNDDLTIYYNGYANPNIHYQVGSGSWTNVPGVAMLPTNEVAGFTHKYTISLGSESYANVCFNDGYGHWDSRNGANYRFEKGRYTLSNGVITKLDGEASGLNVKLQNLNDVYPIKKTVDLMSEAVGGTAPYEYKYTCTHNGVETTVSDFNFYSRSYYQINEPGEYTFTVYLKDSTGRIVLDSKTVEVKTVSIRSFTADKTKVYDGDVVTFTVDMDDIPGTYYYLTVAPVNSSSMGEYLTINADHTAQWTPSKEGIYKAELSLNAGSYNLARKSFEITVEKYPAKYAEIYYEGFDAPNLRAVTSTGASFDLIMDESDEFEDYSYVEKIDLGRAEYADVYFTDGNGNVDNNNGAKYRVREGCYKISGGTVTKFEPEVSVRMTASPEVLPVGGRPELKVRAYHTEGINQVWYYRLENGKEEFLYAHGGFVSDETKYTPTWTPAAPGDVTYVAHVYTVVNGASKRFDVSVTCTFFDPDVNNSTLFTSKPNASVGETVNLRIKPSVDFSDYTFKYEARFPATGRTEKLETKADNTADWTPSAAGTYYIYCEIWYQDKCLGSAGFRYDVSAPTNTVTIYYKGYSNPNIHYQVGSGSWTNVPGIAMTATNEVPGYTHKYTIDLGSASYANVCFNDGHGNWDSRNGANYRFTQGTYKFSNGTITAM